MAADATKIFAGPATKVETSPDGSTWTDLGFMNANAEIDFEADKTELMDGNELQVSGLGKVSVELVQTDSATLGIIKGYRTSKAYLRVTSVDAKTYQVSGIYLSQAVKRGFKGGEPHTLIVTGQRRVVNADDWVTFPA